ncbi:MAG: F0F1 ATP synthase subunit epsilon [Nitrospirae bacterium]|nr:MAG: F0F1 ATP synthase subunit epsilon [Nitrospirota bacterium]
MEGKIKLDIVTPHGSVLSEEVDEITAPGSEGEFGVLAGHESFITSLNIGVLTCKTGNKTEYVFINSGYIEVTAEKTIVLADSAERSDEIDAERAAAAKQRAEERLKHADNVDFARATAALERATTRIQLAQRK